MFQKNTFTKQFIGIIVLQCSSCYGDADLKPEGKNGQQFCHNKSLIFKVSILPHKFWGAICMGTVWRSRLKLKRSFFKWFPCKLHLKFSKRSFLITQFLFWKVYVYISRFVLQVWSSSRWYYILSIGFLINFIIIIILIIYILRWKQSKSKSSSLPRYSPVHREKAGLGKKTDSTVPFHDYESSDDEQAFVKRGFNSRPYTDDPDL